jgi:hypothetical protein
MTSRFNIPAPPTFKPRYARTETVQVLIILVPQGDVRAQAQADLLTFLPSSWTAAPLVGTNPWAASIYLSSVVCNGLCTYHLHRYRSSQALKTHNDSACFENDVACATLGIELLMTDWWGFGKICTRLLVRGYFMSPPAKFYYSLGFVDSA